MNDDICRGLTGHTLSFLASVWEKTKSPELFPWFTLVVAIAKNNLTNDAAAALTQLFCGKAVSEREVRRKLTEVYKLARSSCLLDASVRFRPRELDGRFPGVTGIVDVTTICCREVGATPGHPDATWSGKHRSHVYKIEMWTTMQGTPFFMTDALKGRPHDAAIFVSQSKFAHYNGEKFLADLGYVGMNHVVHEYKKGEDPDDVATGFNDQVRMVRSRVERTFAWLDAYQIFHGTSRYQECVTGLVYICAALEQRRRMASPPLYDVWVAAPRRDWSAVPRCNCHWVKDAAHVEDAKNYRKHLIEHLETNGAGVVVCAKPPAKRARDEEGELFFN
ncbi:unnamed protein product [Bodo saltans]|uniref:DDE Tnp4 domain-containing protein n=1 Tax=Bodo saltans TaxID=75058 RepID=A0A0S4JB70_BODSA|nr:unnamed protein product [Bodo saltans]|eukprot:CUG87327.1 unnamed protein product [Bodo saltans]